MTTTDDDQSGTGLVRDDSPEWEDRPQFDTDEVVDWNCPNCGQDGFDTPRTADYYPICNNNDCAVYLFTVFRGEADDLAEPELAADGGS